MKIEISDFEGTLNLATLVRGVYSMINTPRVNHLKLCRPDNSIIVTIDLEALDVNEYVLPDQLFRPFIMKKGDAITLVVNEE